MGVAGKKPLDIKRAISLLDVSLTPRAPQENVFIQRTFGDSFPFPPEA